MESPPDSWGRPPRLTPGTPGTRSSSGGASKARRALSSQNKINLKTGLFQLEPTFWGFPYKMTQGAMVENHLKVMLNPPIFSQMLVLIWEADQ